MLLGVESFSRKRKPSKDFPVSTTLDWRGRRRGKSGCVSWDLIMHAGRREGFAKRSYGQRASEFLAGKVILVAEPSRVAAQPPPPKW